MDSASRVVGFIRCILVMYNLKTIADDFFWYRRWRVYTLFLWNKMFARSVPASYISSLLFELSYVTFSFRMFEDTIRALEIICVFKQVRALLYLE